MFIVKRADTNMYYTQSWAVNIRDTKDGSWTDNIDYAKVYFARGQATRQKNEFLAGGRNGYPYPVKFPIEVVEVSIMEKSNEI